MERRWCLRMASRRRCVLRSDGGRVAHEASHEQALVARAPERRAHAVFGNEAPLLARAQARALARAEHAAEAREGEEREDAPAQHAERRGEAVYRQEDARGPHAAGARAHAPACVAFELADRRLFVERDVWRQVRSEAAGQGRGL
jgi:hypothetical protein